MEKPPAGRKTRLRVAFLLAQPTKVLLRYFRESNKAYQPKRKGVICGWGAFAP